MTSDTGFSVNFITSWDAQALVALYRAGGWWKEEWNPNGLDALIRGSFLFAVAIEEATGRTVGMGRVISDGVSDAYIQDLVVHPDFRGKGFGKLILAALLDYCIKAKMTWISLIAEPGTAGFYYPLGFRPMKRYMPMIYRGDERDSETK